MPPRAVLLLLAAALALPVSAGVAQELVTATLSLSSATVTQPSLTSVSSALASLLAAGTAAPDTPLPASWLSLSLLEYRVTGSYTLSLNAPAAAWTTAAAGALAQAVALDFNLLAPPGCAYTNSSCASGTCCAAVARVTVGSPSMPSAGNLVVPFTLRGLHSSGAASALLLITPTHWSGARALSALNAAAPSLGVTAVTTPAGSSAATALLELQLSLPIPAPSPWSDSTGESLAKTLLDAQSSGALAAALASAGLGAVQPTLELDSSSWLGLADPPLLPPTPAPPAPTPPAPVPAPDSTDPYASVFPLGSLRTWLTFLVAVVSSSQLGGIFTYLGLPLITGYMFIGALVGPDVLGIIRPVDLMPLTLVTQCALAFICFSAGAELYLPELRSLFKQIMWQTSVTSFVTFVICTLMIVAAAPMLPFLNALKFHHCRSSVAAVAASIMVARSPASAIAIVKEMRCKGPFTSAVLGMTVLGDVYVLILFSLTTSIARTTCDNERFSIFTILVTLAIMLASIIIGWFVGRFLMLLMYFKGYVQRYLILPLGLGIFVFSHWLAIYTSRKFKHFAITLESLLICIVAGYVCTNNSGHRHRFMLVLGKLGPYVFLPFFTLTGASLQLNVLAQSFGFAAVVAVVRAICVFIGSSTGGYMSGVRPYGRKENKLMWMCLLTQAGVSLGLASEMGVLFPGFGADFQTALIAVILINQIVGPVLFRVAARAVGEAGKGGNAGDEWDQDAVVPVALVVGKTPGALAVAARLLSEHWAVTLVCASAEEAELALSEIRSFGEEARDGQRVGKGRMARVMARLRSTAKKAVALPGALVEGAATAAVASLTAHEAAGEGEKADVEASPTGGEGEAEEVGGPELDEHGHPVHKLEEGFKTVVITLKTSVSDAAATSSGSGAAEETEHLLGAGGAPVAVSLGPLEEQLGELFKEADLKRLAACVFTGPLDSENARVAAAVRRVVDAAPKNSTLRSVRLLALLRSPGWAAEFEGLGVMPVHAELHSTFLASKLLTAPRSKPVAVFSVTATLAELCAAVGGVVGGEALQRFTSSSGEALEASERRSFSPRATPASPASPGGAAKDPSTGQGDPLNSGLMQDLAKLVPRSFADLRRSMKSVLQSEEVGSWDNAREEYLQQLSGLDENNALDKNAFGAVSLRSQAAALEEMAMLEHFKEKPAA